FAIRSFFQLAMNTMVLLAIYKGGMLVSKASPVYILSSQTMAVDTLFILIHLFYHVPRVVLQEDLFPAFVDYFVDTALMYCWFHNSLSHILVALNRLVVIVFRRVDVFTWRRTILLSVVHHMLALGLSITTEFLVPCCRLSFSWELYSYSYVGDITQFNYADKITVLVDIPSSLTSMVAYTVIIHAMRNSRNASVQLDTDKKRRNQEYKYAIQFAIMATVYTAAWILFREMPGVIGKTSNLYVYGIITLLVLINIMANATVYLTNNREIKNSIRVMLGGSSKVRMLQDVS
ncbi:hypothetical protein PMAYCL1PPCAC_16528, partial [Pristionchus mayeri]